MTKVWEWLKKNWKWLILPLWLASMVLVWFFTGGRKIVPASGTSDQAANTAVGNVITASDERQKAIADILRVFEEKLKKASVDQLKEAESLKDKPLSEVASWIDKF